MFLNVIAIKPNELMAKEVFLFKMRFYGALEFDGLLGFSN